jgi:hypothetical protein
VFVEEFIQSFQAYDKGGNGAIGAGELHHAFTQLGEHLTNAGKGGKGGKDVKSREEEELWTRRFVCPLLRRLGCTDISLHPSLSFYGDFDELD